MSVEQATLPGILKQVNTFYVSLLVRGWTGAQLLTRHTTERQFGLLSWG